MPFFRPILRSRLAFSLLTFAVIGIIGYSQILRFRWNLNDFRRLAEAEASFRLHRAIRIGSISGDPLTGIEARDVWISKTQEGFDQGVFAHFARARVRYSLLAVLRGETFAARSVRWVEVDEPWVSLARDANRRWNFADMIPKKPRKPGDRFAAKVTFRSGTVFYQDEPLSAQLGVPFSQEAHAVSGSMDFSRPDWIGISAVCRGRSGEAAEAGLSGRVSAKWDVASLEISYRGLELPAVQRYLRPSESWRILEGSTDGWGTVLWARGHDIDYDFRGTTPRTILRFSSVRNPVGFAGDATLSKGTLYFTKAWAHYGKSSALVGGTLTGLGTPGLQLDISVESDHLDFPALWKEWGPAWEDLSVRPQGFGAARLRVTGTPGNLSVSGDVSSPELAVRSADGLLARAPALTFSGAGQTWRASEDEGWEAAGGATLQPFSVELNVPNVLRDFSWVEWGKKRGDTLQLSGQITARLEGSLSNPTVSGQLSAATVRFLGTTFEKVGADFAYCERKALISPMELTWAGGSAYLSGVVDASGPHLVTSVRGSLSGIDLAAANDALHLVEEPIAGRVKGEFALERAGEGARELAGRFEVHNARVDRWTADRVDLWGSWTPHTLSVSRGEISAPMGKVVVTGNLDLEDRDLPLDLRVEARDVDLQALSRELGEEAMEGKAVISGTLTGPARSPSFAGRIQATRGAFTAEKRRVSFDLAQAALQIDPSAIVVQTARVVQGAGWLEGSGRVTDWREEQGGPILDLAFELNHAPLPPLAELASAKASPSPAAQGTSAGEGDSSPLIRHSSSPERANVDGILWAKGWVRGTPSRLTGEADVRVEYAEIEGRAIDRATARLVALGEDLSVERVVVSAGEAVVEGHGIVRGFLPPSWTAPREAAAHTEAEEGKPYRPEFDMAWEAKGLPMATVFADYHRRYGLDGTADARGHLWGPSDQFHVDAVVGAPFLRLAGENIRDLHFDAEYASGGPDGEDRVEIRSFHAQLASGLIRGLGEIEFVTSRDSAEKTAGFCRIKAQAKVFSAGVRPLSGVAQTVMRESAKTPYPEEAPLYGGLDLLRTVGGEVTGELALSGDTSAGLQLVGRNLQLENSSYRGRPLPLLGGSLELTQDLVSVPQFFLYDGRGRLEGQLMAQLPDGHISGHLLGTNLDLGRYADLSPKLEGLVRGRGTMDLVLNGRTKAPLIEGNLVAEDVRIAMPQTAMEGTGEGTRFGRSPSRRLAGSSGSSGGSVARKDMASFDRVIAPRFHLDRDKFAFAEMTLEHEGHRVYLRDGEVPLGSSEGATAADRPIRLSVNIPRQPLALLNIFSAIHPGPETGGELEATVRIAGTLSRPLIRGSVEVESGSLKMANASPFVRSLLRSPELEVADLNARILLAPSTTQALNQANIEAFRARLLGGNVSLTGSVGLNRLAIVHPDNRYDVRISAHGLAQKVFDPPRGSPASDGELGLDEMEARFAYDAERGTNVLRFEGVQAHLGAGQMALSGAIELRPEGGLSQLGNNGWDVVCQLNRVPVHTVEIARLAKRIASPTGQIPPESVAPLDLGSGHLDGQVRIEGAGPAIVQGSLRLSQARIGVPLLGAVGTRPAWGLKRRDFSFLLEVGMGSDVILTSFNVAIRGEATISKTLADLVIAGDVRAGSGRMTFFTQTWDLRRMDLSYQVEAVDGGDHLSTYSKIDVEAVHWARSGAQRVEIVLHLSGHPDQPGGLDSTFSSRPPMSDREIFALLGGVVPAGSTAGLGLGEMLRPELLASLAGQQFISTWTSQLRQVLGFEELTVELRPGGSLGYLSAEKRIVSQLALSFRQDLTGGIQSRRPNFGLVYDVAPQLRLRGAINTARESQVDVLFQIGF